MTDMIEPNYSIRMVQGFLDSPQRNAWLESADLCVYIRKAVHMAGGQVLQCIDIANIEVHRPGQGIFTHWLAELQRLLKDQPEFHAIYVENIQNHQFRQHLIGMGFQPASEHLQDCLYKRIYYPNHKEQA